MRFLDGYWLLRKGVSRVLHSDFVESERRGNKLSLYAAGKKIEKRGDTLNLPMLTTELTAIDDGVIRVDVYHHKGALGGKPSFLPVYTVCATKM